MSLGHDYRMAAERFRGLFRTTEEEATKFIKAHMEN
jgi:hypothetical protein